GQINPKKFASLIALILNNKIGSRQAKDILKISFESGREPEEIMKNEGLEVSYKEDEMLDILNKVIKSNEYAVLDYKKGKESAIQFLIGQAMKEMRGRGDPNLIKIKLLELLK
ncbi:MAG: Asp-tRNA(Asn)/Glu-tRNA(Gln) amidotransferase subunit GatB, partial [Patescibacteria group bacterium]|nr:Asp-tRNA(Asn)/Glu-tRNA(Gln) amidotransferase subunit GatB [Patescibacteria group bacterium]